MALDYYGSCVLTELDDIQTITGYFTANGEYDIKIPIDNLNLKYNTNTLELESIILVSVRKPNLPNVNLGIIPKAQYGTAFCKGLQQNLISGELFLVFSAYKDDTGDYNIFIINLPNKNELIPQTNTEISAVNFIPNFINQDPRVYYSRDGKKGTNGVFTNSIGAFNVNFIDPNTPSTTSYDGHTLTLNIQKGQDGDTGNTQHTSVSVLYEKIHLIDDIFTGTTTINNLDQSIVFDNRQYHALYSKKLDYIKEYTTEPTNGLTLKGILNLNINANLLFNTNELKTILQKFNGSNVYFRVVLYNNIDVVGSGVVINQQYLPKMVVQGTNLINPEYTYEFLYNVPNSVYPITKAQFQIEVYLEQPTNYLDYFNNSGLTIVYPTVNLELEMLEI